MSEQTIGGISAPPCERVRIAAAGKRVFDLAASLLALALLSPFLAIIALAIKRDSPGPVIYRGARLGQGGRIFQILKFRTMFETTASYSGPRVTAHDDPRITPMGRWLRSTKLNELPQFWNVLRGDMSLVGPRPEDPTLALDWPSTAREKILSVRPGITSPASVLYHNEEALLCSNDLFRQYAQEVGPDKLRLDGLYVRYRSFCLDVDTLLWTVLILLPRVRSHEPPESLLLVGPFTRFIRRYLSWFVIDAFVALFAIGCAGVVWRIYGPLNAGWPRSLAAALALTLLFSVTGSLFGVYRISWSKARADDVLSLLAAWLLATVLACGINLLAHVLPFGLIILASLLALCGFVGCRYRTRLVTGFLTLVVRRRAQGQPGREPVLIVGSDDAARYAAWVLDQPANLEHFQLAGFVDDDLLTQGMRIYGARVLGSMQDIPNLVETRHIKVIIYANHRAATDQYQAIAETCRTAGTRLVRMPDFVDSLSDMCRGDCAVTQGDDGRNVALEACSQHGAGIGAGCESRSHQAGPLEAL